MDLLDFKSYKDLYRCSQDLSPVAGPSNDNHEVCNINAVLSSSDYQLVGREQGSLSLKRLVQDPCSPDFYSAESTCIYVANIATIIIFSNMAG